MSQEIRISTASKDKEETSRDLTRRELYHYIFQDFFRGFFLVGCLFLDILVIAQIFRYVPHPNLVMASFKLSLGS